MRSTLIVVLTAGVLMSLLASCATVPIEPLTPGELRLLSMHVAEKEDIRMNLPFVVNISFEVDGKPEIRTACFYFSADGPYCFKVIDVNYGSPGTLKVKIRTKSPVSKVFLEAYVLYIRDGKIQPTNVVGSQIHFIQ